MVVCDVQFVMCGVCDVVWVLYEECGMHCDDIWFLFCLKF